VARNDHPHRERMACRPEPAARGWAGLYRPHLGLPPGAAWVGASIRAPPRPSCTIVATGRVWRVFGDTRGVAPALMRLLAFAMARRLSTNGPRGLRWIGHRPRAGAVKTALWNPGSGPGGGIVRYVA